LYDKKQILDLVIYGQGHSQLILIGYTPPCPEGRYIYIQNRKSLEH